MARQVLIASIKHETNTFSDRPADLAAFHARYCYRGEEIPTNMRGTKVEMAAFFDAADRHGWSLIPSSIEGVSFRGFPNGKKSESMRRTDTEVRYGQSGCVTGRF